MNTRSSTIILKYNNKKATEAFTKDMNGFTWVDAANGEADTLSLSLSNQECKWLKGFFPKDGDFVKVWIKVSDWRYQKDNRTKFCGKFQIDDFGASGFANTCTLDGISIPIRTGFNKTKRNKTYKKSSVRHILQDIAKRNGVALVYDAENYDIKEISQSVNTDLSFAFSLCKDYGLSLKVYNDKLIVYDQTRYEKKDASFSIDCSDLGGENAYSYKRQIANIYDGVKLQYSNKDGKNVTYKYMIPGKKENRILFLSMSADSHKDAERKAKSQLLESLRSVDALTLKVMGDPRYKACQTFKLTGFGKMNGIYFIDKATHEKSAGYYTTIQCHRVVTQIG